MKALGLSTSRMVVKTAIYSDEQKKMRLKQIWMDLMLVAERETHSESLEERKR